MKNGFTKEDIKNSVEYRWRLSSIKWLLVLWAVIGVVMLVVSLITYLYDMENIDLSIQIWLIVVGIYSVILLPFVLFYGYKMLYLLKHYGEFASYEVTLDNVSTSYAYKGAVYYKVTINEGGRTIKVDTNPYFSSGVFAPFALEDYNNKRVVGLYDSEKDKFYIIKKVN